MKKGNDINVVEGSNVVRMIMEVDVVPVRGGVDDVVRGLVRVVYRGLDRAPYCIAPPKNINILYCGERTSYLTDYLEAHFEVCSAICRELSKDVVDGRVGDVQRSMGLGGLYELSKELTDKFIGLYEGKQWDGEWLDTIDDFIKGELFNNTF